MTISVIGVDIAKRVFQVHGVDDQGTTVLRGRLTRATFLAEMATHPPCLVGLEAGTLARIPDYKITKIDDMLPWRWNR